MSTPPGVELLAEVLHLVELLAEVLHLVELLDELLHLVDDVAAICAESADIPIETNPITPQVSATQG